MTQLTNKPASIEIKHLASDESTTEMQGETQAERKHLRPFLEHTDSLVAYYRTWELSQ